MRTTHIEFTISPYLGSVTTCSIIIHIVFQGQSNLYYKVIVISRGLLQFVAVMTYLLSSKNGHYLVHVIAKQCYSGFLWVVPTNKGIFLCSLELCGESRTKQVLLVSKKEN